MSDAMLDIQNVSFSYEEGGKMAVDGVSLSVPRGAFVAVLGQNGSGKSTLAKLMNGLYRPLSGAVYVDGMSTADDDKTYQLRRKAGMVFQNPDNQLVATMVREDVAFGLENIGVPTEEMPKRIDEALKSVGMLDRADRAPHLLSGGQKQRVAIAGVLAMQPDAIIFDEATAMLDPSGRQEVFGTVQRLNREQGLTVVWITHFMEEAALCGYIHVMHEGKLVLSGTPKEVFSDPARMRSLHLDVPPMAMLATKLRAEGFPLPEGILTVDDMVKGVKHLCS